jgi:hypothetical protein
MFALFVKGDERVLSKEYLVLSLVEYPFGTILVHLYSTVPYFSVVQSPYSSLSCYKYTLESTRTTATTCSTGTTGTSSSSSASNKSVKIQDFFEFSTVLVPIFSCTHTSRYYMVLLPLL